MNNRFVDGWRGYGIYVLLAAALLFGVAAKAAPHAVRVAVPRAGV